MLVAKVVEAELAEQAGEVVSDAPVAADLTQVEALGRMVAIG